MNKNEVNTAFEILLEPQSQGKFHRFGPLKFHS